MHMAPLEICSVAGGARSREPRANKPQCNYMGAAPRLATLQQQQQQQPQQQGEQIGRKEVADLNLAERKWRRHLDADYAWLILLVMFLLQSASGGAQRAYGLVFARQVQLGLSDRQTASWPLASSSFVENLAGCLTPMLLARNFTWRRIQLLSLSLLAAANLGAYLSRSIWLDTLCLGLLQGLGLSMSTVLLLAANNDYFQRFRTTAYGLAMSGSTCGTLYLAPIVRWLLGEGQADADAGAIDDPNRFRLAYLALGLLFCLCSPLAVLVVPRASLIGNEANNQKSQDNKRPERKQSRFERSFERHSSLASINVECRIRRVSTLSRQGSLCSVCQPSGGAGGGGLGAPAVLIGSTAADGPPAAKMQLFPSTTITQHHQQPPDIMGARSASVARCLAELGVPLGVEPAAPQSPRPPSDRQAAPASPPASRPTLRLLQNPFLHCAWLMLALYYTISRVFMIALADLAQDHGLDSDEAGQLLAYWSLGELLGRLLLGPLIDLRLASPRHCIALACLALGASLALIPCLPWCLPAALQHQHQHQLLPLYALITALVAALASLQYLLINLLLVEYLAHQPATTCYSLAALLASFPLLARPQLIGLFRDQLGSYDGLLLLLSTTTAAFGLLFGLLEPLAKRRWPATTTTTTTTATAVAQQQ